MTSLPGYDLLDRIGGGSSGEVWRARQLAAGCRMVAVKLVRCAPGDPARDLLDGEARVLGALAHPHLIALHDVVRTPDGLALVMPYAAGGSLADLLMSRDLSAGEVAGLLCDLGAAVQALHTVGIVHGDVSPANVLLTAEGWPLLADVGVAQAVGARGPVSGTPGFVDPALLAGVAPGPACDGYSLAAVGRTALGENTDPQAAALARVLDRMLLPDPAARPDLDEVLAAVAASAERTPISLRRPDTLRATSRPAPEPTRTFGPRPPAAPPAAPRAGWWQRNSVLRWAALGLLGVVAAAGVGWNVGNSSADDGASRLPAAPASEPVAAPDFSTVLAAIDAQRSRAFATADPARLGAVYTPDSPCLAVDRARVLVLRQHGQRLVGLRFAYVHVAVTATSAAVVELDVGDRQAPAEVVDAGGHVVARVGGRGPRSWRVVLRRTAEGWRILDERPL